jgi:hypothetical protein
VILFRMRPRINRETGDQVLANDTSMPMVTSWARGFVLGAPIERVTGIDFLQGE